MKPSRVAIIFGGILITAGVFMLYPTRGDIDSYNDTLPPGQAAYIEFNILFAGRASGDYRETTGRSINLYVYDAQQFLRFSTTPATPQGLFSTSGVSGTFSANIPMPGKYYLVIDQGAGNEQATVTWVLNLKLDGTNTLFLGLGATMIAAGAITAVIGYRAKKKAESQRQPSPQDVVLFDQPPPPPQQ